LTIVEPTFAHLQACIGYDSNMDALLVRDPTLPYFGSYFAETFLKRYGATGPRGMALVPREQSALLAGLTLPDAGLYDRLHELQWALQQHDRPKAAQIHVDMMAAAPDHYLTWQARRTLAAYDAHPVEVHAAVAGLLKTFPDDQPLKVTK